MSSCLRGSSACVRGESLLQLTRYATEQGRYETARDKLPIVARIAKDEYNSRKHEPDSALVDVLELRCRVLLEQGRLLLSENRPEEAWNVLDDALEHVGPLLDMVSPPHLLLAQTMHMLSCIRSSNAISLSVTWVLEMVEKSRHPDVCQWIGRARYRLGWNAVMQKRYADGLKHFCRAEVLWQKLHMDGRTNPMRTHESERALRHWKISEMCVVYTLVTLGRYYEAYMKMCTLTTLPDPSISLWGDPVLAEAVESLRIRLDSSPLDLTYQDFRTIIMVIWKAEDAPWTGEPMSPDWLD